MATLRQLKIFVITAEHKKMSAAANLLFISQSSISQVISELEKEYGVVLFERKSRELRITEAGKLLLERSKKIVNINEALEADMKNFKSIRPLRVGATVSVGPLVLTKLIKEFKDKYPDVDVTVKVSNTAHIEKLLLHNELDVALVEGTINNPAIASKKVFEDELVFFCGKGSPFFERDQVSILELSKQPFILGEKGNGTRAIFEDVMKQYQIHYCIQWESISLGAILAAVINNFGIGVISVNEAPIIKSDELHVFTIKEQKLSRYFFTSTCIEHPMTSQIQDWIHFIDYHPKG